MSLEDLADFPLAEKCFLAYLEGRFPGSRVSTSVLKDKSFIRIFRTGGPARDRFTDRPQMTVQVYEPDSELAEEKSNQVRTAIRQLKGRQLVPGVTCKGITEYSGPANQADPEHESVRYSWSFDAALRASATANN